VTSIWENISAEFHCRLNTLLEPRWV